MFHKRRRKHSRKKNGHRQRHSKIQITKILSKDGRVIAEAKITKKKITKEKNFKPTIILTGGLAKIFKNDIKPKPIINSNLTLEGLQVIGSLYYAKKKY